MPQRLYRLPRFYALFFLPLIAFINCKAQDSTQQNIIVTIAGDCSMSFAELQKFVLDYNYNLMYRNNKAEAYKKGLDDMIVRQLKIIDFFNLGLNKNTELLQNTRRTINEELVNQYFKTQFYGKYVNDKSMQEAYKQMGKEVIYRQVVLTKPKNASQRYIDSLKTAANDIKAKINEGADFAELVRQYSQDAESARLDGLMPSINWKTSISNFYDRNIFDLDVGKVRILEKSQSIHIVKVIKINKLDVQPFEKVKDDITKTLDERYMDFSLQKFDSTKNKFIDEKTLKWDKRALEQLVTWSNIPNFYQRGYRDTLQHAISQGRNIVILKHSKGKVDLKEYLRLLEEVLIMGKSSSLKEGDIKRFILEAVRTNIIVNKANGLNLEKDILNPGTTNPVLKNEIVKMYNRQIIEAQIPQATGEAVRQFYQANKDSLFYQLAKVNIYTVIAPDEKTINELKRKLDQNVPFEKLTGEVFVKTFIRDRDSVIKSYLSVEKPFLGKAAFQLKVSETAGPIEYNDSEHGKQYALIKCIAKREEKQLLYRDVEKIIADEFIQYHREKISYSVQDQLKAKYPVKIYEDIFKQNLSVIGIPAQE
jgi:parvulin-like peptidyl-prolyl isomerase